MSFLNCQKLKDTLWVSAPSTLGLRVYTHIFVVYACKLT